MPTRPRARGKDGNVYTLLVDSLPKNGKVKARDAFGFVQEVYARNLKLIPADEPTSTLRYGGNTPAA